VCITVAHNKTTEVLVSRILFAINFVVESREPLNGLANVVQDQDIPWFLFRYVDFEPVESIVFIPNHVSKPSKAPKNSSHRR
jgi:hypothetical protein